MVEKEHLLEHVLQSFILVTGVIGQVLVANRNVKGFYWWLICNVGAIFASFSNELFGMAILYIFYSMMSGYSIWKWKKLDS